MTIEEWLASLGLGTYTQAFCANHIGIEDLSSLTMEDLKEIGVPSVGHRRRILSAIEGLPRAPSGPLTAPQADHIAGERRQVTVLFVDIAGFTALSSELDAENVHALLSVFFEQVDGIIAEFGGRIDKHIGDCAMAVFGAPIAHSDDVRRAVEAALAIHAAMAKVSDVAGREIAAHAGIATGEVVASHTGSSRYTEYTVTGETVNLASRLTGLARGGETIASADIVRTLADAVDAEFSGSQFVKGFSLPVDVWRVRKLREADTLQRALLGRNAEISRCTQALLAARDHHCGSTIYIRGEPGIGKSSLASEIRHHAELLGFTVLRATVFDFGTGLDRDPLRTLTLALIGAADSKSIRHAVLAYAAAHQLTDDTKLALSDLAGLEHPIEDRRVLDAMSPETRLVARSETLVALALAASRAAPLLIAVEDIHWADVVTLRGLGAIARIACRDNSMTLLMTSRIEDDPLPALQPLMGRAPEVLIELKLLNEQDARKLAERLLGATNPLIEQCVARANGNPLFLEQLIRHASSSSLSSTVPGSIRSLVTAQIDQLPNSDKIAVQTAAVLGTQFSRDAMRQLLGRADWDPNILIQKRLVSSDQGSFHFTHALIRDGVYASILNAERRRLHLAVAEWFAGRDAALHAEHLGKAEHPAAIAAYMAAVDEYVAMYRIDEALALLDRATPVARQPSDRFAVSLRRGHLLTESGRSAEATIAYDQALLATSDEEKISAAKLGKAGALRLLDRNSDALILLNEAEPILITNGRPSELSNLEHLRGNLLFPLGQTAACQTAHQKALAYAESCGSIELKARALGGLGDAAYASGRFKTAQRLFGECVGLARQHGLGRIEVANAPMLATVLPDANGALAEVDLAISAAAAARQVRAELTGHHVAISFLLLCGKPEAVKPHLDRAQEIVSQIGARRLRALNVTLLAEAYRQLGDGERAAQMHEEALLIARKMGMSHFGGMILAFRALATQDADIRRVSLREGERLMPQGVSHSRIFFFGFGIESCLLAQDWEEARRLADQFQESFAIEEPPLVTFLTERCRLLADSAQKGMEPSLRRKLERCRDTGRALGYLFFLKLMDERLG